MNYFMIGGDKREYGPVTSELIQQWIKEGRANGDTLLRLETETEWKPLRSFPEFQMGSEAPPASASSSSAPPIPISGESPRDVPIHIGHAFARAWHLVGEHFAVVGAATMMVWMAMTALLFAPCFGLLYMLFYGPLVGGLFLLFLKLIREGDASPSDIFTLTRDNALSLMLTGVISAILIDIASTPCCLILPGIYLRIAWLFAIPLVADRAIDFWKGLETSRRVITRQWFKFFGLFLLSFLPVVVFHIYMSAREGMDMMAPAQKFWAVVQQVMAGRSPNEAEMTRLASEIEAIEKSYGFWILIKQVLLLISLPFGVGSFAFVYEDIFGRKK